MSLKCISWFFASVFFVLGIFSLFYHDCFKDLPMATYYLLGLALLSAILPFMKNLELGELKIQFSERLTPIEKRQLQNEVVRDASGNTYFIDSNEVKHPIKNTLTEDILKSHKGIIEDSKTYPLITKIREGTEIALTKNDFVIVGDTEHEGHVFAVIGNTAYWVNSWGSLVKNGIHSDDMQPLTYEKFNEKYTISR